MSDTAESTEVPPMKTPLHSLAHRLLFPSTRMNSPVLLLAFVVSMSLVYAAATPRTLSHSTPTTQNPQSVIFEQTEQSQAASTPENPPDTAPAPRFEPSTDPSAENPIQSTSGPSDPANTSISTIPDPADTAGVPSTQSCTPYDCDPTDPPPPSYCQYCQVAPGPASRPPSYSPQCPDAAC